MSRGSHKFPNQRPGWGMGGRLGGGSYGFRHHTGSGNISYRI